MAVQVKPGIAEILSLAAKHGAQNVRAFGSVARGEAEPERDVDLLVEWDLRRISLWEGLVSIWKSRRFSHAVWML